MCIGLWLAQNSIQIKDLLAPGATVIAAIVALIVQWRFNSIQAAIAKRQADIAHDKLKFDLYEKRLGIYSCLRNLIFEIQMSSDNPTLEDKEFIRSQSVLEECEFLFPPHISKWIKKVSSECAVLLGKIKARKEEQQHSGFDSDQVIKLILDEEKQAEKLASQRDQLAEVVRPVLGFDELPGSNHLRKVQ